MLAGERAAPCKLPSSCAPTIFSLILSYRVTPFSAVRMTGLKPVDHSGRKQAASCEQELAYIAEEVRRYPYFFRTYDFCPIRLSVPDCNRLMFSRCM